MAATAIKSEKAAALERLHEWVKPGDLLYTILRHKSASGMQRVIQVVKLENGRPLYLGYTIAKALGRRYSNRYEGVTVNGAGMDMGFELVYNLSMALFCPDKYNHEAAYSLEHEWL